MLAARAIGVFVSPAVYSLSKFFGLVRLNLLTQHFGILEGISKEGVRSGRPKGL